MSKKKSKPSNSKKQKGTSAKAGATTGSAASAKTKTEVSSADDGGTLGMREFGDLKEQLEKEVKNKLKSYKVFRQ